MKIVRLWFNYKEILSCFFSWSCGEKVMECLSETTSCLQNYQFKLRQKFVHKESASKLQNCTCFSLWFSTWFYSWSGFLRLFSLSKQHSRKSIVQCAEGLNLLPRFLLDRPLYTDPHIPGLSLCHVLLYLKKYGNWITNFKIIFITNYKLYTEKYFVTHRHTHALTF